MIQDLEAATIARDVREGLTRPQKELPSKYFYDERGCELFERICELPEYYVTRAEVALLESRAAGVVDRVRPGELVELGPGSPRKARILLDAMRAAGGPGRYVPFDVSRSFLEETRRVLLLAYDGLEVHAVEGDFQRDLGRIPGARERRLVAFLGSTLGNLDEAEGVRLLARVRRLLGPEDRFLLGTDLVKDRSVLERAYDDAAGVTALFNKNVLAVVNRRLGGDLDPARFDHVALWNEELARIEMHLRARGAHRARLAAIDLEVAFREGETIRTEISRKWTRRTLEPLLARSGLALDEWIVDREGRFALSLARPAGL